MTREDVLHKIIDVLSGKQAHLSQTEADELHEAVTPGITTPPPTDEAIAAAKAVLAAQAASQAAQAPAPVAPAAADDDL